MVKILGTFTSLNSLVGPGDSTLQISRGNETKITSPNLRSGLTTLRTKREGRSGDKKEGWRRDEYGGGVVTRRVEISQLWCNRESCISHGPVRPFV